MVACASPGITNIINRQYKLPLNIITVLNGYDGTALQLESSPVGRLSMLYTGTLYFNRNPFPLLKAIKSLIDEKKIRREFIKFILIGYCNEWNNISLMEWIETNSVEDVIKVKAPVHISELDPYVEDSNVLVNFAQGQPNQIPAKIYEYIASGREMLLLTDKGSDSEKIVNLSHSGTIVTEFDESNMKCVIKGLYDKYVIHEEQYSISQDTIQMFSRDTQNKYYFDAIDSLMKSGG
jgi:hypothetical protein